MKSEIFTVITLFLAINSVKSGGNPPPYPNNNPFPPPRREGGLDFTNSVQQAKQQMQYFFAGSKPIKASIDHLENYYEDVKEKDMEYLEPMKRIRRPPCKVLPDPQPGLVNPLLVEPVHKFKPLRRNVRFFGKFAPPISYEYQNDGNEMVVGSMPPIQRQYGDQAPGTVPFPVIQKQTVYDKNPFYGYQGGYNAASDYFQKPKPTRTRSHFNGDNHDHMMRTSHPTIPSTITATVPTGWQTSLNTDYSLRIASMSSALASKSAVIEAMSWSLVAASLSSQWAVREASLKAQLASYSATATSTRKGWHW